ncbi:hypothetical protein [Ilyobacter polytropus]|uniref:CCDC61 coiled-coil domain containing 61 n=1 Tax=Ilyobacter polytropus (strain ATCC 51220 / DSM 2926 / LMG 16218 / CuHBu1) TaxID=572544 RepID=E3H8B4_ILYPC|nr:hypothetical protein [Ilyobacter polytropus]ADO82681.1 CCDC61; coiled-coil domain containing 61 [Ilyobacter polytropus DSM 2926]
MKKRIYELQEQLGRIMVFYEESEQVEGKLAESMVTGIEVNKDLDKVKEILDNIELKLKEEIEN